MIFMSSQFSLFMNFFQRRGSFRFEKFWNFWICGKNKWVEIRLHLCIAVVFWNVVKALMRIKLKKWNLRNSKGEKSTTRTVFGRQSKMGLVTVFWNLFKALMRFIDKEIDPTNNIDVKKTATRGVFRTLSNILDRVSIQK